MDANTSTADMSEVLAVIDSLLDAFPHERPSTTRSPFEEELKCGICLELMVVPITTSCGHTFCKRCIFKAVQKVSRCPTCRWGLTTPVTLCKENKAVAAIINTLRPVVKHRTFLEFMQAKTPDAFYEVAMCHKNGNGVPANDDAAFPYFLRAAYGGHTPSQMYVSYCYNQAIGVPKDLFLGYSWCVTAANAKNLSAFNNLGVMYITGIEGILEKDVTIGMSYLLRSGLANSHAHIAEVYFHGMCGFTDVNAAAAHAELANKKDPRCVLGVYMLGRVLEVGCDTHPTDLNSAFELVHNAAALRMYRPAFSTLARFYDNGIGCVTDKELALEYYIKSNDTARVAELCKDPALAAVARLLE